MTIAKQSEEYIKHYFKEKYNITLIDVGKGEVGFDSRDESSKLFVEVKSSGYKKPQGFYFTNAQYEKVKSCQKKKKTDYEIHLVVGMGSKSQMHCKIPVKVFLKQAEPVVSWYLTVRKADYDKYKLNEGNLVS